MKNYIGQLNGKEQNAVHCIKKLITNQLNALIIYCFGCKTNVCTRRSAFIKNQFKEERQFTCDLLIVTPDATIVDEEKRAEIQEMIGHFGTVNMVIHPLGYVLKQMNEGNLFFNWVYKRRDAAAGSQQQHPVIAAGSRRRLPATGITILFEQPGHE